MFTNVGAKWKYKFFFKTLWNFHSAVDKWKKFSSDLFLTLLDHKSWVADYKLVFSFSPQKTCTAGVEYQ